MLTAKGNQANRAGRQMRVLVIQNFDGTGLGQLRPALDASGARLDIRALHDGGTLPERIDGHDALIVLGGGQNALADDEHPYLTGLVDFIRDFTASGRAVFHPRPHMLPAEMPDDDFPVVLNTGRVQHQWHTLTKTGKVAKLTKQQLEELAQEKMEDLNTSDLAQAKKIIAGTARSMGIDSDL